MISRKTTSVAFNVLLVLATFLDYSSKHSNCNPEVSSHGLSEVTSHGLSDVSSHGLTKFLPIPDKYGVHNVVPSCAFNFTQSDKKKPKRSSGWCLHDYDYPKREIENALFYHFHSVAQMYKDVLVDTSLSVNGISSLTNERYLCPTETDYVQPLRALNTNGEWRIIVNQEN